jgi:acetoacetyl-CoA reductase/3-oxoacyl-[acyl-carrier protein] reductase
MIILIGASGGIGSFLMNKYLYNGIDVVGTFNSSTPEEKLNKYMYQVDITSHYQVESFKNLIIGKLQNIVLINCAGINYNSFAHKADPIIWESVIKTNLIGTFNLINCFLPYMRKQKWGRIINFSSIVPQIGVPGTSAYAASKAALWGLAKAITAENNQFNITINTLNLGYFNVGMINEIPPKMQEEIRLSIPSGKFGEPEEIYNLIDLLIKNSYIRGTAIDINGGLH